MSRAYSSRFLQWPLHYYFFFAWRLSTTTQHLSPASSGFCCWLSQVSVFWPCWERLGVSKWLYFGWYWPDNRLTVRIPYTQHCTESIAHAYMAVPIILTAANDTLVFLAISYRMVSSAMVASTWRARTRSFFTGEGLYHLSKSLLQSGQAYYW